jgi:hypothetical protein
MQDRIELHAHVDLHSPSEGQGKWLLSIEVFACAVFL